MLARHDDPRSVDELFAAALRDPEENETWNAIWALQARATSQVLERAIELGSSFCAFERRLGAHILAQFGGPDRKFEEECLRTLLRLLEREPDETVIEAILTALSHRKRADVIVPAYQFRAHACPEIRHAVVHALTGHEDDLAISALIELTRDPVAHVRDWATFGLGTLMDVDSPEIREAFVACLSDPDNHTRCEALVGLARRHDRRVLPALRSALDSESVWTLEVEAASHIAAPELLPLLIHLREWWDVDSDLLEEAILACSKGLTVPSLGESDVVGS